MDGLARIVALYLGIIAAVAAIAGVFSHQTFSVSDAIDDNLPVVRTDTPGRPSKASRPSGAS